MKFFKILFSIILLLNFTTNSYAETWNEPWQKEIIKKADFFVLGKIITVTDTGAEVEILKSFEDTKLGATTIVINSFSLLNMTSSSGHGLHLNFQPAQIAYFFLTKGSDGNYAIPTPTSGFATVDENNNVAATYRHSYHQASISQEVYEKTYSEIWSYYKTGKYNQKLVLEFINENLDKKPAGFADDEIALFFLQHAALETAYLLDIPIDLKRIEKFITTDNFHARVSALQLLSNSKNSETKDFLLAYIKNDQNGDFEKVIAIWSLSKIGDPDYQKKLIALENSLSDEETGFGGNIMDPRIGTHFPSPKGAVQSLKQ